MQTVSLIAAMGKNREIGYKGDVPWNGKLPADFAYFKETTMGRPIIMGRRTFDSIGRKPLPGRKNIVITRQFQQQAEGAEMVESLEAALERARYNGEVFVIGGAEIYRMALPIASYLYLTRIDADFPADTFFPEFDPAEWRLIGDTPGIEDEKNLFPYRFQVFEKQHKEPI